MTAGSFTNESQSKRIEEFLYCNFIQGVKLSPHWGGKNFISLWNKKEYWALRKPKVSLETFESQTLKIPVTLEQSGELVLILNEFHYGDLRSSSANFLTIQS